jgi:hypothetical protein
LATALAMVLAALAATLAGCGPAPTPEPPQAPNHFAESGLVFDYPAAWRAYRYEVTTSFYSSIAFLGTVEVADPCVREVNSITCGSGYALQPGTLVVDIQAASFPGFSILDLPAGARPISVDGLPGYVEEAETAAGTGATAARTWSIARPGSIDNYYRITANVRTPNEAAMLDLVDGIVRSIRYDPPVTPLPPGQAAAEAAAEAYLQAARIGADPSWACFPPGGGRSMTVASLPNGPPLEQPREATCTTTIAATPMQVWEMTLEMRLAERDPNGGWGTRMTVYVGPDGEGAGGGMAVDLDAPAP